MISLSDSMSDDLLPYSDTVNWNQGKLTPEAHSTSEKIQYYAINALQFLVKFIFLPVVAVFSLARSLTNRCISWFNKPAVDATPSAPKEKVDLASVLPPLVGFADSLYQSSLLGTPYSATCKPGTHIPVDGTSYWAKNLNSEHIEWNHDSGEYRTRPHLDHEADWCRNYPSCNHPPLRPPAVVRGYGWFPQSGEYRKI